MSVRALFVTWFGGGNVRPVLAAAADIIRLRGEAAVLSNPEMARRVRSVGAEFHAFARVPSHNPARPETDAVRAYEGRSIGDTNRLIGERLVLGPARAIAFDTEAAIKTVKPDVMLVDYTLPGAMAVAEKQGIPFLVATDGIYPAPYPERPPTRSTYAYLFGRMIEKGLAPDGMLRTLRADYGLPPISRPEDIFAAAEHVLVMTFPILNGDPAPPKTSFVGPQFSMPERRATTPDPNFVLATFSTIATPEQDVFVRNLAETAGDRGWRILIAAGASPVPDKQGVEAVSFLDFSEVLPRCALTINHAGNGTVVHAVAHGCPQLSVPFIQDQHETAKRLAELGLSEIVPKTAWPHEIADAIERGLADRDRQCKAMKTAADVAVRHRPALAAQFLIDAARGRPLTPIV